MYPLFLVGVFLMLTAALKKSGASRYFIRRRHLVCLSINIICQRLRRQFVLIILVADENLLVYVESTSLCLLK